MSDDRPVDEPVDQIAQLRRELDDLRSTVMVRASRRPTGDIEPTIRTLAKGDTLLLQGQAVNRLDHPALWQWVQDQGLIMAGLFTVGNGSTTFGLPDFRGRVPVGAGVLGADSYALGALVGASTKALAVANLPAHDHSVAVATHGNHGHTMSGGTGTSGGAGAHGGHFPTGSVDAAAQPGALGVSPWNSSGAQLQHHTHAVSVSVFAAANTAGPHTVTEASVGSGTPLDVRQASIAVNWLIYT